jgi:acetyltransferase
MMQNEQLDKFFNPKIIAVIGASDRQHSVGGAIFANIKNSAFAGKVVPVNNRAGTVLGDKTFASVADIVEKIDLAIIATPAAAVLGVLDECARAGIPGAVIVSSGFKEAGDRGKKNFAKIQEIAKSRGIRVLGPNCLGFANPKIALNASFAPQCPLPGGIAFISQSGALCDTFLDWSLRDNIGFSHFVSIGSIADIGFAELIEYFNKDKSVNSILLYMESLNDGQKFLSAARAFCRDKPIVCLKAGANAAGAGAAASHTGAIAGDDKIFSAAFDHCGVIRAATVSDLYNYAKTLNHFKKPAGNRLAIITNAGGPGVVSADFLTQNGGQLAKLAAPTIKKLNAIMPSAWSRSNPIDVLGDGAPEHYRAAAAACLEDKNIDGIMAIISPQAVTQSKEIAEQIASLPKIGKKPVFGSFMGAGRVAGGVEIFRQNGIPVYRTPEKAAACFLGLARWQKNLKDSKKLFAKNKPFAPDKERAAIIIRHAMETRQSVIAGENAREILQCYQLPCNTAVPAKNAAQAAKIAKQAGFPAALKLQAKNLLHKTELRGVRLNLAGAAEVKKAFAEIMENARKHLRREDIDGISVEKMIFKKYEIIAGIKKDPVFGPAIIFGAGGTAAEIFGDAAAAIAPLNEFAAKSLMSKTKIFQLLKGYRGENAADIRGLAAFLAKLSRLPVDFPQIKEIDVNPLAVDENGAIALDAKIIIDLKSAKF